MWDQEGAYACIEGVAATKKKLVRRSSFRLPVPVLIFAARSLFNASPTPSIFEYMIVIIVYMDC